MPVTYYAGAHYRAGHQGYLHCKTQSAALMTPAQVTDPSTVASVVTPVGPAQFPAQTFNENMRDVMGIGDSRVQAFVPGRRERGFRTRVEIADGTVLQSAVRNHTTPSGGSLGLPYLTFETGTGSNFDSGSGISWQYLDALINSVTFNFGMGQTVSADMDVWAPIALPGSGQTPVIPAANVLHWGNMSWQDDGQVDYMSILAGGRVSINNNLERVLQRQMLYSESTELAISRTARKIVPKMEMLQVSYQLQDMLPATLAALGSVEYWPTMVISAIQPGSGSGLSRLTLTIDNSKLNRTENPQVDANGMITFTADVASAYLTVVATPTSGGS